MMHDYAVVIPTYDRSGRQEYLVQAVDSVLGQTLPASEVIVVSDGPAAAVCEALSRRPVKILEQPAGGAGGRRNEAIAASSSEWICFLDDDDLWHPDLLRVTDEFIRTNNNVAAVNSSYWTFGAAKDYNADLLAHDLSGCLAAAGTSVSGRDTSYMDINGRSFELLLERNRCAISSAMVRRDIAENAGGFPADVICGEDWMFFLNVARLVEWHYIPQRLSFVRQHATQSTRTEPASGVETLCVIHRMWAEEFLPVPAHRPLAAYGRDYGFRVQQTLWTALRNRRFDLALHGLRLGMPLLPSWRDRIYALTPPQLTWRMERMSAPRKSGARRQRIAEHERRNTWHA